MHQCSALANQRRLSFNRRIALGLDPALTSLRLPSLSKANTESFKQRRNQPRLQMPCASKWQAPKRAVLAFSTFSSQQSSRLQAHLALSHQVMLILAMHYEPLLQMSQVFSAMPIWLSRITVYSIFQTPKPMHQIQGLLVLCSTSCRTQPQSLRVLLQSQFSALSTAPR